MDFELKQIKTSLPFLGFIESRQGGRPENQDSCGFADTLLGLLVVVCDGMGGGPGGKTASMVAVETIVQVVRSATADSDRTKTIEAAVRTAHLRLLALQKEKPSLAGMGTTATILLINKQSAMIAHVGDSRIYQLRWGNRIFRTEDHSLVGEMVRKKTMTEEEARLSPNSNIIQRALGVGTEVEADICERPYEKGDRFVLCTDGVWNVMPEKELIENLARTKTPSGAMEKTMIKVSELGMANGGNHDNFTMAMLITTRNSILKETMTTKTRNLLYGLTVVCGLSLIGNVIQFTDRPDKMGTVSQALPNDSSKSVILEQEKQMKEQEKQMNELEKQLIAMRQKYDDILGKLETIQNTSTAVADIVKENNAEEKKAISQLVAKLDALIEQLVKLRDMLHGDEKDELIVKTQTQIKSLSKDLLPYGIDRKQLDNIVKLLNDNLAKSDINDPKYKKLDRYKGHWEGTKAPNKGIITLAKELREEINKKQ